ncbi:MAG: hypothetical protein CVT48_02475 [Thermoplasmata archaeon HGW-Thermoplasmata-1]|nr:MAG: hypothetical protein CVT48_02475 [Thermoplasmata archaeon HGW-Thermoplasmata-1]
MSNMKTPRAASKIYIYGIIMASVLVWALSFPFIKIGLDHVSPFMLGMLRSVISAVVIGVVAFILYGPAMFRRSPRDWLLLFALGLTAVAIPNVLQNIGMQYTSASIASIIQCSGPVFTIVMAALFLKERLTPIKTIGIILAMTGVFFILTGGRFDFSGSGFYGNLLQLITAFSYSISGILGKMTLNSQKYEPLELVALYVMTGGLMLALSTPFFAISEIASLGAVSLSGWGAILFLSLLPSALAYVWWYKALDTMEISRLTFFVYLIPVESTIISHFWLGDEITWFTVLFGFVTVAGVAIAQWQKPAALKKRPVT